MYDLQDMAICGVICLLVGMIFVFWRGRGDRRDLLERFGRIRVEANEAHRRREQEIETERDQLRAQLDATEKQRIECEKTIAIGIESNGRAATAFNKGLAERDQEIASLKSMLAQRVTELPYIADLLATLQQERQDFELRKSQNYFRSPKATEMATKYALQSAEFRKLAEMSQARVRFYETMFPWLEDFSGQTLQAGVPAQSRAEKLHNEDPVSSWLTEEEYSKLTQSQRNQLALDRWRKSRRSSPWHAGRDYERYIGWQLEKLGYSVEYFGVENGKEDMGRDLIATDGEETLIVQCKYWLANKVVHEKHIFLLLGTTLQYVLENIKIDEETESFSSIQDYLGAVRCAPRLVTSASVSPTAQRIAAHLGVEIVEQEPMSRDYPIIKCNISRKTGEKIYHLPFDPSYDATVIEPDSGELYAATIVEAELLGFRRAFQFSPE